MMASAVVGLKDRRKGEVDSGTVLGKPTEEGESPVHEIDVAWSVS